jgi:hypothetical protein
MSGRKSAFEVTVGHLPCLCRFECTLIKAD